MEKIKISPSILSADFANLGRDVKRLEQAGADYIHVDVMDGVFVPNITIGHDVVAAIRSYSHLPLDVHLMVQHPENHIENFAKAGADIITVHSEASLHLDRLIVDIKSYGKKAGVSIVPSTSPEVLRYIINKLDLILVMSVNPGFGGQKFIDYSVEKIARIVQMCEECDSQAEIEVDGGINQETAKLVKQAGANILVAGSYIFSGDLQERIASLKS